MEGIAWASRSGDSFTWTAQVKLVLDQWQMRLVRCVYKFVLGLHVYTLLPVNVGPTVSTQFSHNCSFFPLFNGAYSLGLVIVSDSKRNIYHTHAEMTCKLCQSHANLTVRLRSPRFSPCPWTSLSLMCVANIWVKVHELHGLSSGCRF